MTTKVYDAIIIGGGPAGLSMAVSLARQAYTALVIDSGVYRNARATHMHTVPGFDHVHPADFRAKIRKDLQTRYDSIDFASAKISTVRKVDNKNSSSSPTPASSSMFEAVSENGDIYKGKKLGLAIGVRDKVEDEIPGYAECWGRGVFHCLFCHGFEERGAPSAGVLATGLITVPQILHHVALMTKRLARSVTIYTNGNTQMAADTKALLPKNGAMQHKITFDERKIASLSLKKKNPSTGGEGEEHGGPEVIVTFEDGTQKEEGFVASHPLVEPAAPFPAQLGLEMTPTGEVVVKAPSNETSVAGCFAAGDVITQVRSVVTAVHAAGFAAVGMISQLMMEMEEQGTL